jgi:hypothetical protein
MGTEHQQSDRATTPEKETTIMDVDVELPLVVEPVNLERRVSRVMLKDPQLLSDLLLDFWR